MVAKILSGQMEKLEGKLNAIFSKPVITVAYESAVDSWKISRYM